MIYILSDIHGHYDCYLDFLHVLLTEAKRHDTLNMLQLEHIINEEVYLWKQVKRCPST